MTLTREESEVYTKYHKPGCASLIRVQLNAIFINTTNSEEHELAKFKLAWKLRKMGFNFITEAVSNIDGRRVDLVNLTEDGIEYELETDPKRAERFKGMKNVYVVKLWDKSSNTA